MLRILKFAEKSSIVENFSVLDFRRGTEFYYVKMELLFKDGSHIYMREYLSPSERHYSFHWQLSEDKSLRWDNSPHYPSLETYPNHLHVGERTLVSHCSDPVKILSWIETLIKRQINLRPENTINYLDELR
jgi:hypothetical protein